MATPRRKRTIVIVEDSVAIAAIIRECLETEPQYRAVVVHDGRQALDAIRGIQADLVLLDVDLPGLRGPALYEALRADPATAAVPVLFITAHTAAPEFTRLGVTAVLAKPFDLDELLAEVDLICGAPPAAPAPPDGPAPAAPASDPPPAVLDGRYADPAAILDYLTQRD